MAKGDKQSKEGKGKKKLTTKEKQEKKKEKESSRQFPLLHLGGAAHLDRFIFGYSLAELGFILDFEGIAKLAERERFELS
jgi:hypothetical protein